MPFKSARVFFLHSRRPALVAAGFQPGTLSQATAKLPSEQLGEVKAPVHPAFTSVPLTNILQSPEAPASGNP
ncbi:MAG: hypothetical protein WA734_19460, partial [Candidatus Acidiferrales bacterium]